MLKTACCSDRGGGGGRIVACKTADPCYFLARSVDPTLFLLKIEICVTELLLLRDLGVPSETFATAS